MHIARLVFEEPQDTCEIKVGAFFWMTPTGELCDADFYLKTCARDQPKQVDDLNQQLTDEWQRLENQGNTKIRYQEIIPSPIFSPELP